MLTTKSQTAAIETMLSMAELFFSGVQVSTHVKLRLYPLLIGATGSGKSALVEEVARQLKARYFKVTRSDWLVTGCRYGRPTTWQIMDLVQYHDRVVLHLDELDKIVVDYGVADWAASVAGDYWNVLDNKFQVEEYLHNTEYKDATKPSAGSIQRKLREALWVAGSGTFQDVFVAARPGASVGFSSTVGTAAIGMAEIAQAKQISPELLHRFGEPLFLTYPDRAETVEILEKTGLKRLALSLGVELSPESIDWTLGGMRVLETIATRLALERKRKEGQEQVRALSKLLVEPLEQGRSTGPAAEESGNH